MNEYRNELLESCTGRMILLTSLAGPDPDDDKAEEMGADPMLSIERLLHSRTRLCVLQSFDFIGIVISEISDDPVGNFVPWGAVINVLPMEEDSEADNDAPQE